MPPICANCIHALIIKTRLRLICTIEPEHPKKGLLENCPKFFPKNGMQF